MKGRTIIIVHPSELVSRGLTSILETMKGVRVLSFSAFPEFKIMEHEHATAEKLMLFIPTTNDYVDDLLALGTRIGAHHTVGLLESTQETSHKNAFNHVLSLNSPAADFIRLAENYFLQEKPGQDDELTNREREVLKLIAMGQTNKSIADNLFISMHTVISHRKNITEKLGIRSIPGLTVYAIIKKIIDPEDMSPDQLL